MNYDEHARISDMATERPYGYKIIIKKKKDNKKY